MMYHKIVGHSEKFGDLADALFPVLKKTKHFKAVLFGYRFEGLAKPA